MAFQEAIMEMTQQPLSQALTARENTQRRPGRARLSFWRSAKDWLARTIMGTLALFASLLVVIIGVTLAARSWPLLSTVPLVDLLTSRVWQPMQGAFGYGAFIVGSVAVTVLAIVFAVLPAVLSGIFLAEYTSTRLRAIFKPLLDLLAGIPSVVYGLWGVLVIVPLIRDYVGPWLDRTLGQRFDLFARTNPSGYGLLAGGLVLAVMVFPFIVSVTEEVLRSVPRALREATLSLGATRWEATKVVVLRSGLPGILAAVVLGVSRAFGETLAIMMVTGNVAQIPRSLFDPVYPLPALIANNYGEMMSVPLYESALMGASLLLLAVVVLFNITARLVMIRLKQRG
jgi:phosphate transport system permease protein